ncbi:flavin-containing monooxygenase [Nocardia abscessus]|uniref:flavin-containing monooxygenase n=1 Tax=Nocardia abscessus TaxID=120957 RepID=UPI00245783B4|nr:NAD(P)/FAD-dependent oxidoreductase [Nocardia abscessus]
MNSIDSPEIDLKVAIVGGGFGGLAAGIALREDGITDFEIFEEADDVGGVWRENAYPGCNCDVPSHLYSLSAQPYRGEVRYPGQPDILTYLRQVAGDHGLYPHLRLRTAIAQADFDEDTGRWRLVTAQGQIIHAEIVIFAVGMLHRRHLPDIAGRDTFGGVWFHSAQWDHTRDLRGRRVAVIGTGASAVQLIPELAATAEHVRVFQRTPTWVLPKPRAEFGRLTRALLRQFLVTHQLYRSLVYHVADLVLAPLMTGGWSARPAEWFARAYLRWQVRDPRLRAALTPTHRIGAKRILLSRTYYRALGRDTVELITTPIDSVTQAGIRTVDGVVHEVDTIVYATGFRAAEFLAPIRVVGRGGTLLHQYWDTGGGTFLGLAAPKFPNAYFLAGPNTFNSAGSNVAMKESQLRYVMAAIRLRETSGATALEVSAQAMAAYERWLHEAIARTVWPTGGPSWYKTTSGRVVTPWPSTARAYARMTARDPALVLQRQSVR